MLERLYIKNYAIIDEVELGFSNGLTIITGETGAGKSILLGALELILGKRADHKVLKDPREKCIIEATFNIKKYNLQSFFEAEDLDFANETMVRRELLPSGKSRAFINDTPTKLSALQSLCDSLIDMHRQFATQDINNVSFQIRMLDALAGNQSLLKVYDKNFTAYQNKNKTLEDLRERANATDKELDFIKFQLNEFEEANIQPGEMIQLEKEQKNIENADAIQQAHGLASELLVDGENNVAEQLRALIAQFSAISGMNDQSDHVYQKVNSLLVDVEDLARELGRFGHSSEYDEGRLTEIGARLDTVYRLLTKHQKQSEEDLLSYHQQLQQQVNQFDNITEDIEKMESEISVLLQELMTIAQKLSTRRREVVKPFIAQVEDTLSKLNMANARLDIQVKELESLNTTGIDHVQFLFSSNPGSAFLPVKNVASGGELSRLTLAVKSKVADAIPLPTLIYDEIDTGISGGTAMQMGQILGDLSANHQVIVITHTPQVAVKADKHFYVSKSTSKGQTKTQIQELNAIDRINAIAMMLSGDPPSAAAIENAKQLLAES